MKSYLNIDFKSYFNAVLSGYLLLGAHMLTQIILTPFYLKIFGAEKFGILMILLNIVTFAVFGISWFSGGLVRLLGEYWSKNNFVKFNETLILGKYVFTSYSLTISIISLMLFYWLSKFGHFSGIKIQTIILIAIYFILNYEALSERQAFIATNWQTLGNFIELIKVIVFAMTIYFFLPFFKNIDFIFYALILGVLSQRILTGLYLKIKLKFNSWGKFNKKMLPDFKRFAGKQGFYYFSFGTLLLLLQLDVVIIGIIAGPASAGKFVLLWKIPEVMGLILGKIPSSLEPKIIHIDSHSKILKFRSLFLKGKLSFFILCFIISCLYIFFGEYLVTLWVGDNAPTENWMYFVAGIALFFFSISRWPISFAFAQIKLVPLVKLSLIEFSGKLLLTLVLFDHFTYASPLIAMSIIHIFYVAWGYQRIET